jgi:hypothetical protein
MHMNRTHPAESINNNVSESVCRITGLLFVEFVLNVIISIQTA